jgi:transposase
MDEKLVTLRKDKFPAVVTPHGTKRDYEYERCGTANVFVLTEPKGGRHSALVTQRRTRLDFADCLKWIADQYQDAITIHLVMDNLNTHTEKSLTNRFGHEVGRRLWARFQVHYTPKHASWLNQAEIAINVMTRSAIGTRAFPTKKLLEKNLTKYWAQMTEKQWKISWKFTPKRAKSWLNAFDSNH